MKISAVRPKAQQLELFDRSTFLSLRTETGEINAGLCRVKVGQFYEERAAEWVGGDVHQTDSRADYCPDVSRQEGGQRSYFEVKAVGRSNCAFVYGGRLERDLVFAKDRPLTYLIWRHTVAMEDCDTARDLVERLWLNTAAIYLVPFEAMYEILKRQPLQKLNSKYGKSDTEPQYGSGYRLALSKLENFRCSVELVDGQFQKAK